MLTISPAQMEAFTRAERAVFADRLAAHVRAGFPDEADRLGPAGLRDLVDAGVVKAAAHGIEIEADVSMYVVLMAGFGPDFETDPAHPWARQVLQNPEYADPSDKAAYLFEAGLEEARRRDGLGPDDDR